MNHNSAKDGAKDRSASSEKSTKHSRELSDPLARSVLLSKSLRYYKRKEVREAIALHSEDREVSVKFENRYFGKRPEVIVYPEDVFRFAIKKASSFHISEERWFNPLQIRTGWSRKEADELRKGWDLVLDVDCPHWFFSKLTTRLFIDALLMNGIKEHSISVKFSGNKGFHIGVPFEAFPEVINDTETRKLFPEAPRAIASYILKFVEDELIKIKDNMMDFGGYYQVSFEDYKKLILTYNEQLGTSLSTDFIVKKCNNCGRLLDKQTVENNYNTYFCSSCGHTERIRKKNNSSTEPVAQDFIKCPACGSIAELMRATTVSCPACGSKEFRSVFNVRSIIEVDTVLLASRHLFRAPYSLHEKSGLSSVVIPISQVLSFEKKAADPNLLKEFPRFLDPSRSSPSEGADLLSKALSMMEKNESLNNRSRQQEQFDIPDDAIPSEFFPPTIKKMLGGLKDGRKRALFALINFLRSVGWSKEQIEKELYEWNNRNDEPLREVYIKGQLRYAFMKKEVIPPPNYSSNFYKDLGVLVFDDLERSKQFKNPVQYAKFVYETKKKSRKKSRGKSGKKSEKNSREKSRTKGG